MKAPSPTLAPYLRGYPRLWAFMVLRLGVVLSIMLTNFFVINMLEQSAVLARNAAKYAVIGIGAPCMFAIMVVVVRYEYRVNVRKAMLELNQILCPVCAYPIFVNGEVSTSRTCAECGTQLHYPETVAAWAKVPAYRRLFRELANHE